MRRWERVLLYINTAVSLLIIAAVLVDIYNSVSGSHESSSTPSVSPSPPPNSKASLGDKSSPPEPLEGVTASPSEARDKNLLPDRQLDKLRRPAPWDRNYRLARPSPSRPYEAREKLSPRRERLSAPPPGDPGRPAGTPGVKPPQPENPR